MCIRDRQRTVRLYHDAGVDDAAEGDIFGFEPVDRRGEDLVGDLLHEGLVYPCLLYTSRAGGAAPLEKFKDALAAEPRYLQKLPAPPAIETAYSEPVPHLSLIHI